MQYANEDEIIEYVFVMHISLRNKYYVCTMHEVYLHFGLHCILK